MNLINTILPQTDVKLNIEKIKQLLQENTPNGLYRSEPHHTKTSLANKFKEIEKETGTAIPNAPFLPVFYNLDAGIFRTAHLYRPQSVNHLMIRNPQLENITNIGKGLTQLIPIPLVNVYEGEQWALPKVQIYQGGEVIEESNLVGEEIYSLKNLEEQEKLAYDNVAKYSDHLFSF